MTERVFSLSHQQQFGNASQDHNPLHLDPLYARRLLFGRAVVHGMHLVLWTLDEWVRKHDKSVHLTAMSADFRSPVKLDQEVMLKTLHDADGKVKILLTTAAGKAAVIGWEWQSRDGHQGWFPAVVDALSPIPPSEVLADELPARKGTVLLPLPCPQLLELFPSAAHYLSLSQVQHILAISRVVGMECPGLHSIFRSMKLLFCGENTGDSALGYQVVRYDSRVRQVDMKVASESMAGEVTAFLRPAPVKQPDFDTVTKQVNSGEFSSQRAIVIGGTRGLGELTVKLLAAGGADVWLSYHRGEQEAVRINDELHAAGAKCHRFRWDVLAPIRDESANLQVVPTHLYYFATPFIFEGVKKQFSYDLFSRFCAFYVKGFIATATHFAPADTNQRQTLFYPSSVAIDEMPLNMGEYVAAKAAGEYACRFLQTSHKNLQIEIERLPRLATDQTASVLAVHNEDPLPILLSTLRRIHWS